MENNAYLAEQFNLFVQKTERAIVDKLSDSVLTYTQGFSDQDSYLVTRATLHVIHDELSNVWERHNSESIEEFISLAHDDLFEQIKARATHEINKGKDGVNELPKSGGCS